MLGILMGLIRGTPLIFFSILTVYVSLIVFIHHNSRKSRFSLIAAYFIGLLVFALLLIIHSPAQKISWGFSTQLPPLSFWGLITYGSGGILLTLLSIKVIRIFLANNSLQAVILFLVGSISFLAFYYFIADEQTSNVVVVLVIGSIVAILLQSLRQEIPLTRLLRIVDRSLIDAGVQSNISRTNVVTFVGSCAVIFGVILLAGFSALSTGTPVLLVPSNTPTMTFTPTPTFTPTLNPSPTPLLPTSTQTYTPLPTAMPTNLPTLTAMPTKTLTSTATNTLTLTNTALPTKTKTPRATRTLLPTETNTLEPTDTLTPRPSRTSPPTTTSIPQVVTTPFGGGQGRIVFVLGLETKRQIWTMKVDGSNRRQLTFGNINWYPSWSPDGKYIIFQSARGGTLGSNIEIYVMDANGQNERKLTNQRYYDDEPVWSPNGRYIAFVSRKDGSNSEEIYKMAADGSNWQQLTTDPRNVNPAWSPDSQEIIFTKVQNGTNEIWAMNADGSNQKQLTNGSLNNRLNHSPAWSPDGRHIAFASKGTGKNDIYVMNPDGSGQIALTQSDNNIAPAWSPDSQNIIFVKQIPGQATDLYSVDMNGLSRPLTNDGLAKESPAWQP